jgi:hypothetical protein
MTHNHFLMTLSRPTQWALLALLAALMTLTRGQHFASLDALPSASWAVFFLAGVLLRPTWVFPALFAFAFTLDVTAIGWAGVSDHCFTPAYAALVPAYGSLWLAGQWYARRHRDQLFSVLPLAFSVSVGAGVCYLFSGGGFYFFSGREADPTLLGFLPRIAEYLPRYFSNLSLYVGTAALIYGIGVRLRTTRTEPQTR